MLFLLSPAKSLDYETPVKFPDFSTPQFVAQAAELVALLRTRSTDDLVRMMDISEALATLNVQRFRDWRPRFTAHNSRQAILAFDGDVYDGMQARNWPLADLQWAQEHVCILSGLYGVLRPLDRMQPYRLEMGSRLATPRGSNLYQFWGSQISLYLNDRLRADKTPVVVNLASQEYFKAVDLKSLRARVVECVFEEFKSGQYKVISFMAKRARGLMARYAVTRRLTLPHQLESFDVDGYAFDSGASSPQRLVFRRKAS